MNGGREHRCDGVEITVVRRWPNAEYFCQQRIDIDVIELRHAQSRSERRSMRDEHSEALRLQRLDALAARVKTRSLRDVLSRRGGTFDLKHHAITPIVNLARWGGLSAGVGSASTPARLSAAAQAGAISDSDADTLCDVFVMLQRLRIAHQVAQIAAGHTPGDVITMSDLSPLNRSLLNEGLREIVGVQRRVRNVGIPPG